VRAVVAVLILALVFIRGFILETTDDFLDWWDDWRTR